MAGSQEELSKALATVLQQLNIILGGGFPLPRASKEELTSLKHKLAAAKPMISIPEDRLKVETRLLELTQPIVKLATSGQDLHMHEGMPFNHSMHPALAFY
eukprot:566188-Pelagomonas_calceolata.AAC.2